MFDFLRVPMNYHKTALISIFSGIFSNQFGGEVEVKLRQFHFTHTLFNGARRYNRNTPFVKRFP